MHSIRAEKDRQANRGRRRAGRSSRHGLSGSAPQFAIIALTLLAVASAAVLSEFGADVAASSRDGAAMGPPQTRAISADTDITSATRAESTRDAAGIPADLGPRVDKARRAAPGEAASMLLFVPALLALFGRGRRSSSQTIHELGREGVRRERQRSVFQV